MPIKSFESALREVVLPERIEYLDCGQICFPLYSTAGMMLTGGAVYLIRRGYGPAPEGEVLPSSGQLRSYAGDWLIFAITIPYDSSEKYAQLLIETALEEIFAYTDKPTLLSFVKSAPRRISRKVRAFLAA